MAHLNHTAQPGGAELALSRVLAAGPPWRPTLYAPPGTAFETLPGHGVPVTDVLPPLPGGGTRGRDPFLVARYLRALSSAAGVLRRTPAFAAADLVHANTAAAGIIAALALRGRSTPLVLHLRDLVAPESLGRAGYETFTRLALPRAAGLIANSRTTLESAGPQPARRPVAVIPSPLGVPAASNPVVRPRVEVVGMLGRLQRWKGQHVFLTAFADLFRGTGVRALIAGAPLFGEEAYERELRALVDALGITAQVRFLGHVDDVAGFLDSVDVLVHASIRPEPLGQTVLQGLARGRPVVATAGGGPAEWIADGTNGLLVPADEPDALRRALARLADSAPLRSTLVAGAVRTAGMLTDNQCARAHGGLFALAKERGR